MNRKRTSRRSRRPKMVDGSPAETVGRGREGRLAHGFRKRFVAIAAALLILGIAAVFFRSELISRRAQDSSRTVDAIDSLRPPREDLNSSLPTDAAASEQPGETSGPLPESASADGDSVEIDVPPRESLRAVEEQERVLRQEQIQEAFQLVERFPNDQNAIYLLGLIHQEQGDIDAAFTRWQQCQQLDAVRSDLYDSFGQGYVLKGQLGQAIEMFRKALALQPDLFGARVRLANALMREGRFGEVVTTLEPVLPLDVPADATDGNIVDSESRRSGEERSPAVTEQEQAYLLLGQACQQEQDLERARKAFLRALDVFPESSEAHYGLARVYAAMKDPEQAKYHQQVFRDLEQAKQTKGREVRQVYDPLQITRRSVAHTHTDLARVYQRLGEAAEAERLFRRAMEVSNEDVASRLMLAEFYQQSGRLTDAAEIYQQLIELQPRQAVHWFHLGNVNVLLKNFRDAEEAYRKTIELAPDRADGYRALAQFYLVSRRNIPEAVVLARTAVDLDPSAPVYALLGDLCDANGNRSEALRAMEQAVRLDPANPRYRQRRMALSRSP